MVLTFLCALLWTSSASADDVDPVRIALPIPDEVPPTPAASGTSEEATPGEPPFAERLEFNVDGEQPFAERLEYDLSLPHEESTPGWDLAEALFGILEAPAEPIAGLVEEVTCLEHTEVHTELDDHAIGLQPLPSRPDLLLETNERFLGGGLLEQGVELPTGAVWRPSFWVFGQFRTGISHLNNRRGAKFTEWANRLDLFGQLNLSGTERLLIGMRPLDREVANRRVFSAYDFQDGDSINGFNSNIQTLFFEGDIGEIFPNLDPEDTGALDYGFSVGRQPMLFQQGLLINEDMIDALTVTRNTVNGGGNLNMRLTSVFAWKGINRNNNMPDRNAQMFGLFTESDFEVSTVNADVVYLNSESNLGSQFAFALSSIQRHRGFHNTYNSSLHALVSIPTEGETPASGRGVLLFGQLSWTPHHREDLIYANGFWAIDQFTSPARGPLMGGPLGQTGIIFAAPGLGQFGAPISNQASEAFGGSLGYQLFFDGIIGSQLVLEVGGRKDTNDTNTGEIGGAVRYQQRLDQHWILVLDSFLTKAESRGLSPGARIELLAKF